MPTYHIEDGQMSTFNKRFESMKKKLTKTKSTCICKEVGRYY